MFLALTRLPQIGAPITTGFLSCRMTIAVNWAAIRHHPFKYLQNIAANCRRAKAYGRSPKNMRRYNERKAIVEAEDRPPRTLQSATNEAIARRIRAYQRAMD